MEAAISQRLDRRSSSQRSPAETEKSCLQSSWDVVLLGRALRIPRLPKGSDVCQQQQQQQQ